MGLNDDPAELTGHGPITAHTARDIAFNAGSTWKRLITDPLTGQLKDYGRTTYRPPVALNDHVRARDVTCRVPNCSRPAIKSDLDHIIAWPAGSTSEQNLETLCRYHHRMKHEGRYTHQVSTDPAHPPGTIIITTPAGQVYLSYPHRYPGPSRTPPPQRPQPVPGGRERRPWNGRFDWPGGGTRPPAVISDDPGEPPF